MFSMWAAYLSKAWAKSAGLLKLMKCHRQLFSRTVPNC